jgi:hypothetical protein
MSQEALFGPEPDTRKPWQRSDSPPARVERLAPEDAFDGRTYVPELDYERLGAQMRRVWDAMSDGQWWTLAGLSEHTGDPEASVSARIRDLRKKKMGGYVVVRQRIGGGLYRYRLELEEPI